MTVPTTKSVLFWDSVLLTRGFIKDFDLITYLEKKLIPITIDEAELNRVIGNLVHDYLKTLYPKIAIPDDCRPHTMDQYTKALAQIKEKTAKAEPPSKLVITQILSASADVDSSDDEYHNEPIASHDKSSPKSLKKPPSLFSKLFGGCTCSATGSQPAIFENSN